MHQNHSFQQQPTTAIAHRLTTAMTLALTLACTLAFAGCGKTTSVAKNKLVGKWEMDMKMFKEVMMKVGERQMGTVTADKEKELDEMIAKSRMDLEFRDDGTFLFEMQMGFISEDTVKKDEGTWEVLSENDGVIQIKMTRNKDKDNALETDVQFIRKDTIQLQGFMAGMPGVSNDTAARFNRVN